MKKATYNGKSIYYDEEDKVWKYTGNHHIVKGYKEPVKPEDICWIERIKKKAKDLRKSIFG